MSGESPGAESQNKSGGDWGAFAQNAARDARLLTGISVIVSGAAVALCALLAFMGLSGMWSFTLGLLIGCVASTINLRVLATATTTMFSAKAGRSLLAFGGSFILLVVAAITVLTKLPNTALGFAAGIAMPGIVGIVYAYYDRGRTRPTSEAAPAPSADAEGE